MLKRLQEYILLIIFIVTFVLSYILEKYRIAVFITGLLTLVTVLMIVIMHFLRYTGKKFDISLAVVCIALLFSNGRFVFSAENMPTENSIYFDCLAWVLAFATILSSIYNLYLSRLLLKTVKSKVFGFIIYTIIFGMIFYGSYMFSNYAFDMSETKQTEFVIVKQLDDGHSIPGYFNHIFIEYEVETVSNDIVIKTLSIPDTYKLQFGDRVKVTYRKGIMCGIYFTEYDPNIWSIGNFIRFD